MKEMLRQRKTQEGFLRPKMPVVDLAKELIAIPSVRGNSEAMTQVLGVAKRELADFTCEEFERNGDKSLLFYNRMQRPEKFRVLLHGHLDVVSGNSEQFNPYDDGENLYGRGAQDMKAGAAALITVFRHIAPHLPYPIALQLVTDEEVGGFNGAGYQVEQGVKADFMITGESTDLHIANQHKGVFVFDAKTDTLQVISDGQKPGHAAYILAGQNAILEMTDFLGDLKKEFPVPEKEDIFVTTVNPAVVTTENTEHNKVPTSATARVDIRYIHNDADGLEKRVHALLPEHTIIDEDSIVRGKEHYTDSSHPDVQLLRRTIKEILGNEPEFVAKKGSSDARFYDYGVQLGPKGKGLHTTDESVNLESLDQYTAILMNFLQQVGENKESVSKMPDVLFICQANVGRSQMAEGFFNAKAKGRLVATSAGIIDVSETYNGHPAKEVNAIMAEEGVDISQQKIKLVTENMIASAKQIIVFCSKDECPEYIQKSEKALFIPINDPYGMGIDGMRQVRDEIKQVTRAILSGLTFSQDSKHARIQTL